MPDAASQHIADPSHSRKPRYSHRGPYRRSAVRELAYVTLTQDERNELHRLRRAKGISTKELAASIGIESGMLYRYQCGERRPPRWVLEAWRKELS